MGLIQPATSSMLHNLSTMIFGAMSTKSVLSDRDISNDIEVEAIQVADAS